MFAISVTFRIQPDNIAEFRHTVIEQARNSLAREPDCLTFEVCHSLEDETEFLLYEIYRSADAFEAHKQTDHYAVFSETVAPWVEDKGVHRWYPEHSSAKG
jgi:autoinducer 2-degrading protein